MGTRANQFKEDWKSNTISPNKWDNWGAARCYASDNSLKIDTALTATYAGILAKDTVDLTESSVMLRVVDAGNQSLTTYEATPFVLELDTDNSLFFLIGSGSIYAYHKIGGITEIIDVDTYNSAAHKWLRIRESGGEIYWDVSPDGLDWTQFQNAHEATPFAVTDMDIELIVGCYGIEVSTTTLQVDNLNVLPNAGQIRKPNLRPHPFSPCRAR